MKLKELFQIDPTNRRQGKENESPRRAVTHFVGRHSREVGPARSRHGRCEVSLVVSREVIGISSKTPKPRLSQLTLDLGCDGTTHVFPDVEANCESPRFQAMVFIR